MPATQKTSITDFKPDSDNKATAFSATRDVTSHNFAAHDEVSQDKTSQLTPFLGSIHEDVKKLFLRLLEVPQGGSIKYLELSEVVGQDIVKIRSRLSKARKMLLNLRNIVFRPLVGIKNPEDRGLRRLTDKELATVWRQYQKTIGRQALKGASETASAEYDKLSQDEQVSHQLGLTVMGMIGHATQEKQVALLESKVRERMKQLAFKEAHKALANGITASDLTQ